MDLCTPSKLDVIKGAWSGQQDVNQQGYKDKKRSETICWCAAPGSGRWLSLGSSVLVLLIPGFVSLSMGKISVNTPYQRLKLTNSCKVS